jgi:hypothetical protein
MQMLVNVQSNPICLKGCITDKLDAFSRTYITEVLVVYYYLMKVDIEHKKDIYSMFLNLFYLR